LAIISKRRGFNGRFGTIAKALSIPKVKDLARGEGTQESSRANSSLLLLFVGIAIFIIANLLATFYLSFIDVMHVINVDNAEFVSNVSFISIDDPFHGGCLGLHVHHETWEWLLFTGIAWGNDVFLQSRIIVIIQELLIASLFFLIPLLFKQVREAVVPSILLFLTGTLTIIRGFIGMLGKTVLVLYFGGTLDMGYVSYDLADIGPEGFMQIMMISLPVVLVGLVVFSILGYFYWKSQLKERGFSAKWFILFVMGTYLVPLFLSMW
jgi:flagellar biosynthesis protein FliQ